MKTDEIKELALDIEYNLDIISESLNDLELGRESAAMDLIGMFEEIIYIAEEAISHLESLK